MPNAVAEGTERWLKGSLPLNGSYEMAQRRTSSLHDANRRYEYIIIQFDTGLDAHHAFGEFIAS